MKRLTAVVLMFVAFSVSHAVALTPIVLDSEAQKTAILIRIQKEYIADEKLVDRAWQKNFSNETLEELDQWYEMIKKLKTRITIRKAELEAIGKVNKWQLTDKITSSDSSAKCIWHNISTKNLKILKIVERLQR